MNFESKGQSAATIAIAVIVIAIVAGGAYYVATQGGEKKAKNPDTLIVQRIAEPETLDPAWAYDTASGEVIFNVYEPLIFFEGTKTDEYVSRVATDWNISDDGTTYRFKIREDVTFHNGNSLTPEDVEYSLERVMVMDRTSGPSWMLLEPLLGVHSTRDADGNIKVEFSEIDQSVEVDGNWVQLNLAKPYPPFMGILAQTWSSIIDKEWAANQGAWPGTEETWKDYNNPDNPPLNEKMNGTGPFQFDRWKKQNQIVLSRYDDYWRDPANFKQVKFQMVGEWSTRKSEFLAGNADIIGVPRAHSQEVIGEEGVVVHKNLPALQTNPAAFFTFNITSDKYIGSGKLDGNGIPPDFFSDEHVRKAFAYSFRFQTYIEDALLGQAKKVPGPIPSAMKYFNDDQEMYEYDSQKVAEHFKKAYGGSLEDPGPVWENGFEMTITYNTDAVEREVAAQIFNDTIENINDKFTINTQAIDWGTTYLPEMVQGKLPIFIIGWAPDFPDPHNFVTPFMHSTGTFSGIQGYSNPEVDDLIDQAISSTDPEERRSLYYELQEIYHEEVPNFPLCEPTLRRYHRDWIEGWYHNPLYMQSIYAYPLSKG